MRRSYDNYNTNRSNKSNNDSSMRIVRRGSEIGTPTKVQTKEQVPNLFYDFEGNEKLNEQETDYLANDIKSHEKLENLQLNLARCKSMAKTGLSKICETLQGMKNLNRLSLNLMDNPELDDLTIAEHGFVASLTQLTSMSKFALNLSKCKNLSNSTFTTIVANLCTIKRMSDLELDLAETKLSHKGMAEIIQILMEKRDFRRLSLKLGNNPSLDDVAFGFESKGRKWGCFGEKEVIYGIGKLISVQKSLIRLELWLPYSIKLKDEGLIGLGNGISKNRSIRELLLDVSYCDRFSQKSITKFFESLKENHISSLELFLGGAGRIKSIATRTLANLIHYYVNLTKLRLQTENCNEIDPESLKMLGAAIGKRKKLTLLDIDISRCNEAVDSSSFSTFLQNSSEEVNSLNTLKLDLGYLYRINDKGVAKIGKFINSNLKHLHTVKLTFCESQSITDSGIFGIYDALKKSKKISCLELEFKKIARIKDDSIIILSDAIQKMAGQLETLTFDVSDCHKISDRGICVLARAISHLAKLKTLKLVMRSPEGEITDVAVKDIGTGLCDIPELENLDLSFENNQKITEKEISGLLETISQMQHLISLRVNLRGTLITESIQSTVLACARKMSSLLKVEVLVTKTKFPKGLLDEFKRNLSRLPHLTRVNVL